MHKKTLTRYFYGLIDKDTLSDEILFSKTGSAYIPVTKRNIIKDILYLNNKLRELNIKKGDKTAIISENRPEWVATDFACILEGIISVPVYNSLSTDQIKYILKDSGAKACFVSSLFLLEKILKVKDELTELKHIVSYNLFDEMNRIEGVIYYDELMRRDDTLSDKESINSVKEKIDLTNEDDVFTIIYTSGTTGNPKGVMLTHKNVCSDLDSCNNVLEITEKDRFLSFLPYCHAYERTAGYYLAFLNGAKIYYAQNIDTISTQMPEVKPTILISVPRLLDKMYNRVMKSGEEQKGFRKKMFNAAVKLAHSENPKRSFIWKIYDTLVYKKIKAKTGGHIRYIVSGGGALNKKINMFMNGIGVGTLEGYGMTEASPVIAVNLPGKNKPGTVGPPLKGVEIKIAGDGEILAKGDIVMKGYYKLPEETANTIIDGWLHTGDIGEMDSDGYVKITDRKKSLFKTSGGKYIAPAMIENLLMSLSFMEQIIVIGNERMYITALIVPNKDEIMQIAKSLGLDSISYKDLIKNEKLVKHIEKKINEVQKNLSTFEKVRKITLLENPFTLEADEMTPTLKLKRKEIEKKYTAVIEKMYLNV
jgi:long-chain acyl-CoA synthetase